MPFDWIPKNPRSNVTNQANQVSMSDAEFADLLQQLIHQVRTYEEKLECLLHTKGFFSAEQSAHLLSIFARPKDKLRAVMILEPKLVSMTCQQARNILAVLTVHEDRLEALHYVKRALNDANTQEGVDNILSTFIFEDHKVEAMKMLSSIVARKGVQIAAGGHQGYSPLGNLYTTAPPNYNLFYGDSIKQVEHFPNHHLVDSTDKSTSEGGPGRANSKQANGMYSSNNPDYHDKQRNANYQSRNEYLNPYKVV